jgi:hypothetical protein
LPLSFLATGQNRFWSIFVSIRGEAGTLIFQSVDKLLEHLEIVPLTFLLSLNDSGK